MADIEPVREMGFFESAWWSFNNFFLGKKNVTAVEGEVVVPPKIPIVSDVMTGVGNIVSGVSGTIKNLPIYLFVILGFLGLYLLFMGRKGKTVI